MNVLPQINETRYARLLAKILPRPIRTQEENRRMTELLLKLDEREDLSAEEEQLAEMLTILIEDFEAKHSPFASGTAPRGAEGVDGGTRVATQRYLAGAGQQGRNIRDPQRQTIHQQSAGEEAG